MLIAQLEVTAYKAQTAVARERQRSAETVLITIFSETVSQHTKLLAVVEERADTDAAVASQETVKLYCLAGYGKLAFQLGCGY